MRNRDIAGGAEVIPDVNWVKVKSASGQVIKNDIVKVVAVWQKINDVIGILNAINLKCSVVVVEGTGAREVSVI